MSPLYRVIRVDRVYLRIATVDCCEALSGRLRLADYSELTSVGTLNQNYFLRYPHSESRHSEFTHTMANKRTSSDKIPVLVSGGSEAQDLQNLLHAVQRRLMPVGTV